MVRCLNPGWARSSMGGAGSMYTPEPISDRPARLGFSNRARRYRPRGSHFFCSRAVGVLEVWEKVRTGDGALSSPGGWFHVRAPANQQPAKGVGVSTPCKTVSTRGDTVFILSLSELRRYGRILIRRWDPILSGCCGTVPLSWLSILHWWRWLYKLQL